MYCVFCGSERSDDALFCHKCGKRVFVEHIEDVIGIDADFEKEIQEHMNKADNNNIKDIKDNVKADKETEAKELKNSFDSQDSTVDERPRSKTGLIIGLICAATAVIAVLVIGIINYLNFNIISDDGYEDFAYEDFAYEDEATDIDFKDSEDFINESLEDFIDESQENLKNDFQDKSTETDEDDISNIDEVEIEDNEEIEGIEPGEDILIDEGHSDLYISEYKEILKEPDKWLKDVEATTFKTDKFTYGLYNVCGDSTPELLLCASGYKKYGRGKSNLWYIISCNDEDGAYLIGESEMGVTDELQIYKGQLSTKIITGVGDLYIERVKVLDGKFMLGDTLYSGNSNDDLAAEDVILLNYAVKNKEPFDFVE